MFIGEYNHNIDSKGRVILPAKFRDILGDCFYITKGNDGCLFVYTAEGWGKLQEKLSKLRYCQKQFEVHQICLQ